VPTIRSLPKKHNGKARLCSCGRRGRREDTSPLLWRRPPPIGKGIVTGISEPRCAAATPARGERPMDRSCLSGLAKTWRKGWRKVIPRRCPWAGSRNPSKIPTPVTASLVDDRCPVPVSGSISGCPEVLGGGFQMHYPRQRQQFQWLAAV
jgi:hypothetical protein